MPIKIIKVNARTRDCFHAELYNENNQLIHSEDGYVPSWMPGYHYGDSFNLEIDNETGVILNWKEIKTSNITEEGE